MQDVLTWGALIAAGGSLVAIVTFWMNRGKAEADALAKADAASATAHAALAKAEAVSAGLAEARIEFARDYANKGRMYYTMDLRYQTPSQQVDAVSRGMSVSHEYSLVSDPTAKRITSAKLGGLSGVFISVTTGVRRCWDVVPRRSVGGLQKSADVSADAL